jgi:hypothetical protein
MCNPGKRCLVLLLVAVALAGACRAGYSPSLISTDGTPADLRALAERTWNAFIEAFPARAACLPDAHLIGVTELGGRAAYRPEVATVLVRIPATRAQLEPALVHEFAHHLERHCVQQWGLRKHFLRAQGLGPEAPWFTGDRWETTPSEQFAEATVEVVLGYRSIHHRLMITEEARRLIAAWGRGEEQSP